MIGVANAYHLPRKSVREISWKTEPTTAAVLKVGAGRWTNADMTQSGGEEMWAHSPAFYILQSGGVARRHESREILSGLSHLRRGRTG